jgi:hypothetical protein
MGLESRGRERESSVSVQKEGDRLYLCIELLERREENVPLGSI